MLGRRVAAGWNGMLGCLWKRNCQGATQAMEEENVAQLFERIRGQEKAPPVFDRCSHVKDQGMKIPTCA